MNFEKCPYLWKVKSYQIDFDKLKRFDFTSTEHIFSSYKSLDERLELNYRAAFNPELYVLNDIIDFEFVNIIS